MIFTRPCADNSVRGGQLCPDSHQVRQSDEGLPRSGAENYQLSDWGVQSWLSDQEISSQTGGHLSLCSLYYEVSLYWEGTIQVKLWEKCSKASYQIRTCSSEDLDCVETLPTVDTEDCLERCEGTIMDVTKLGTVKKETVMARFNREYELYKHQQSDNLRQGK